MRALMLFLVGLVLGACGVPKPLPPPPPVSTRVAMAARLEAKTVAIVQGEDDEVVAYCTGVWVSRTTILTAAHCTARVDVGEALQYVVHQDVYAPASTAEKGTIVPRPALLYARDKARDLALLRAAKPPTHAVALTRIETVEQGSFAQVMGHSLGLWYSYSSGDVSAVRTDEEGTWIVQTTAPISPGNSGGGLVDGEGQLIGIAHGYLSRGQSLNIFVHKVHIDALLSAQGMYL